jgi:hypothetical protein
MMMKTRVDCLIKSEKVISSFLVDCRTAVNDATRGMIDAGSQSTVERRLGAWMLRGNEPKYVDMHEESKMVPELPC